MIKKVTETVHNMFVRHHLTCFIVIATPLLVAVVADAQTLRNEAARIDLDLKAGTYSLSMPPAAAPAIRNARATVEGWASTDAGYQRRIAEQTKERLLVECARPDAPSLLLAAASADIEGGASLQESKSVKNIGTWTAKGVKISWAVDAPAGVFNVALTYACATDCAGSEFDVTVGDQMVSGHTESTGSFDDFKTLALGEIKIAKSGEAVVTIKATKMSGPAVMNLSEVKLTPVSK